jgi:nicotinamide-nucleotide amidase
MLIDDGALGILATRVGEALRQAGWRLALAESCTGGWVAKSVTDVAGSSGWFERGFVTYSNSAKEQQLGVSAVLLAAQGAVSAGVVEAMARGALQASPADVALAISGIAGPDGGTSDKPVGLVWFAVALRGGATRSQSYVFEGNRDAVRRAAVAQGLALIAEAAPGG